MAFLVVGLLAASCGNQNGTTTNSPTPDSEATNGVVNPSDTGMGITNSNTQNNNSDTAHGNTMMKDSMEQHRMTHDSTRK